MSMNSKNLSVLAYANGFTLWHYKTADAKTTVSTSGYFNDVANIFNVGDLIVASLSINGTMETKTEPLSTQVLDKLIAEFLL